MDMAERERPSVTVDIVVVAKLDERREVLLVRRKKPPFEGCWALPGGFVEPNEPLEAAAQRELREETGIGLPGLRQLHTFGDPGRDPRGWTISVAFLALPDRGELESWQLRAGSDAGEAGWFELDRLPELAFDHAAILARARKALEAEES